jgi:ABC-2 type transport system ATP-binding protein
VATAISIEGVGKRFSLHHERQGSLKERIIHLGRKRDETEDLWALRHIDLEVQEGETVGLLGHNGSGKSTLLKCIGGILRPNEGEIRTRGRLAALLELGAGFHPDLTGRENVYLNGSILGLSKKEIERRFDAIVDFSELENFIDNQVKYYSSGMYVRLGFAVAINVDPDILLVDEVLSVGDEVFQLKCLDRVRDFQAEGRTIVFVTHAADLVRQICDRALVLEDGNPIILSEPNEAVRVHRERLIARHRAHQHGGPDDGAEEPAWKQAGLSRPLPGSLEAEAENRDKPVVITGVEFEFPGKGERPYVLTGEWLTVRVLYETRQAVPGAVFTIALHDLKGDLVFGTDSELLGAPVEVLRGIGEMRFRFDPAILLEGKFMLSAGVRGHDESDVFDHFEQYFPIDFINPGRTTGLVALPVTCELKEFPIRRGGAA